MTIQLYIEKTLVLSTAHYTRADDECLEKLADPDAETYAHLEGGWILATGYGYLVHVPTDDHEEQKEGYRNVGMSEPFLDLYSLAHSQGCTLVRFDRDVPKNDKLASFDW